MEFLRGKDLARVMFEEGPLATKRVVDIVRRARAEVAWFALDGDR